MNIKDKLYKRYNNNLLILSKDSSMMWFVFSRRDYGILIDFLGDILYCDRSKIKKLKMYKNFSGIMTISLSLSVVKNYE